MIYNFYCIMNLINNKKYVGLTTRDINVRFSEHIRSAMKNHDLNNSYFMPFYNSMRKYGIENYKIELIESIDFHSFSDAEEYEGILIKKYNSMLNDNGYNLNYIENGKRKYVKEIKEKIIDNNTNSNNPFWKKTHSEETKRVISEKAKIRFSKPENNPRYGYKFSDDDKLKSRQSMKKYSKPFYGDGILYESLKDASKKINLTPQAIRHRIKSKTYVDWFYV